MRLKRTLRLGLCGILISFTSCNPNENLTDAGSLSQADSLSISEELQINELTTYTPESYLSEEAKQLRAASITLSEYIVLENNQYRLDVSEQEALKLGIASNLYKTIKDEIASTNAIIQKTVENGDTIEMCDVQAVSKAYKNGTLKANDNSNKYTKAALLSGFIKTDGQEDGTACFKTEYGHKEVLFRCRTHVAPTPIYYCAVSAWGTLKKKTMIGNVLTTTNIVVPIAACGSNITAGLTYATTDSYGGYCFWNCRE